MSDNKYNYTMRYVPMKNDVIDPAMLDFSGISSVVAQNTACVDMTPVINACLSAIEAMTAMTAMVYMKCMQDREE